MLNIEGGEIHKELLTLAVEAQDVSIVDEVPGIKLKKLRNELQNQMAQKRSEQWQHKTISKKDDGEYIIKTRCPLMICELTQNLCFSIKINSCHNF